MKKTACKFLSFTILLVIISITNLQAQGTVTVNQDPQIDALLKLKKSINKTKANYKIQIYNGNRKGAEKARLEFRNSFGDWATDMKYETPNYKIWIGNFNTRLEADRALLRVKKKFTNAFILAPKKKKSNP